MHLDLSSEQLAALTVALERQHEAGDIVYGIHTAKSTILTCLITNYDGNHVHFVDGADGGYALAAKQLKSELKKLG